MKDKKKFNNSAEEEDTSKSKKKVKDSGAPREEDSQEELEKNKSAAKGMSKCPSCGADLTFNPENRSLVCPYCGHEEEIILEDDEKETAKEERYDPSATDQAVSWGSKNKLITCKTCGAESIYDVMQSVDACPYCGSVEIIEAKDVNAPAPGGICPFEIDKDKAVKIFKDWIKDLWFCPSDLKADVSSQIKGIYLPFWTFDTKVKAEYTARFTIDEHVRRHGETEIREKVSRTKGRYEEDIDDWQVLATNHYDADLIKDILPFQSEKNMKYKPEYLAGFSAERCSMSSKEAWKKAQEQIDKKITDELEEIIKKRETADSVDQVEAECDFRNVYCKNLMLPIWLVSYKHKDKVYHIAINGQTGKIDGQRPYGCGCCVIPTFGLFSLVIGIGAAIISAFM